MVDKQTNTLKLMVVGDGGVGKSCFITQFLEGKYVTDHPPSNWKREQRFQKRSHELVVSGVPIRLDIMELNDELFRLTDVATEAIYPDAMIADCYIYLFNLSKKESLHGVGNWKHEMERYNVGPHRKRSLWMMVGHKMAEQDFAAMICQAEAKAQAMKMKFMAASACTGENVEKAILSLLADTLEYQKQHCNEPLDPWATSDSLQPPPRTPSPLLEAHEK